MKIIYLIFKSSRRTKEIFVLAVDIFLSIFSTWISFLVRLDLEVFLLPSGNTFYAFLISPIIFIPIFLILRIYKSMFRYFDFKNMQNLLLANVIYLLIFSSLIFYIAIPGVPRSIGLIQSIIFLISIFLSRLIISNIFNYINNDIKKIRVLIYGAGKAGVKASKLLLESDDYSLVGFVDDDKAKVGRKIFQYNIYSNQDIEFLKEKYEINLILIAISNINDFNKNSLIKKIETFNIKVKVLPNINKFIDGNITINDFRDISVLDLIERRVVIEDNFIDGQFKEKNVIITGAGGSIGSELCRQIIKSNPSKMVLIDNSEFNLYKIESELTNILEENNYKSKIISKLISTNNQLMIENIFGEIKPNYIFHAAAYKHVPIVEGNIVESIENNFIGTVNVVTAALKFSCENFVLISTDKAVRPTNIMGATKRLSEMFIQAINNDLGEQKKCLFSIVRFGNVLDSSGSVVPVFRRQINSGGPVTVTHPDITRYFMTIPEAANLILQAASFSKGGEIFLLDMGNPIKISDLAKKMINLSGLKIKDENINKSSNTEIVNFEITKEIEIKYTGLRPGEKLYEELMIDPYKSKKINDNIFIADENFIDLQSMNKIHDEIQLLIRNNNVKELVAILKKTIEDFNHKKVIENY